MTTTIPQLLALFDDESNAVEDADFYTRQLITYIGNKRSLAPHLERALIEVRERVGGRRLRTLDLFAGSGFVGRLMKKHSEFIAANDLELYSRVVNDCYLANARDVPFDAVEKIVRDLNRRADLGEAHPGFIQEMYAPKNDEAIELGERAFYSSDNARRLDFFAQELAQLDTAVRDFVLAPLLSSASVHANTSGVFKGFYKDKNTGVGKFGGAGGDALKRILDPIRLEVPILSRSTSEHAVFRRDANELIADLHGFDLVYIDPPYNQHPYGSNYFMLNLLVDYQRPAEFSEVSGIPVNWNRSRYNVRRESLGLLSQLFREVQARFLLVSFNGEGYVSTAELREAMERHGRVDELVVPYNTFRGSRNLRDRSIHVNEHLFLLDRES